MLAPTTVWWGWRKSLIHQVELTGFVDGLNMGNERKNQGWFILGFLFVFLPEPWDQEGCHWVAQTGRRRFCSGLYCEGGQDFPERGDVGNSKWESISYKEELGRPLVDHLVKAEAVGKWIKLHDKWRWKGHAGEHDGCPMYAGRNWKFSSQDIKALERSQWDPKHFLLNLFLRLICFVIFFFERYPKVLFKLFKR